jgi:pSer/pThr/pTyr-binding forkhead associated (FHA) protein
MHMLTLTIMSGPNSGCQKTTSCGQDLLIGRARDADFAIMDPRMSRLHFRVCGRMGIWHVVDLRSTNGTLLNENLVTQADLQDGDGIRAGDTSFHVYLHDPPAMEMVPT